MSVTYTELYFYHNRNFIVVRRMTCVPYTCSSVVETIGLARNFRIYKEKHTVARMHAQTRKLLKREKHDTLRDILHDILSH